MTSPRPPFAEACKKDDLVTREGYTPISNLTLVQMVAHLITPHDETIPTQSIERLHHTDDHARGCLTNNPLSPGSLTTGLTFGTVHQHPLTKNRWG